MSFKKRKPVDDVAITDGFIFRFLEGLDTPRSLAVWMLYKSNEHLQLANLDPNTDCEPFLGLRSVDVCRRDYLATEFLSKADFLKTNLNLEEVALDKFLEAEKSCHKANLQLYKLDSEVEPNKLHHLDSISEARRKIANLLGEFDPLEFIETVNWGPGATAKLSRSERLAYDKFRLEDGMSPSCLEFWPQPLWDVTFPRWKPRRQSEVAALHTVPKNSKTNRCIIIEPGINTFFQKALGQMIRRRLAKIGIRLRTQADYHQKLVPSISKSGDLATVDFSAASDTISRALVFRLLPDDWHAVLDAHRSARVRLPDGSISFMEKFSSMGNGFTFELETLIFWALARSICPRREIVSVYGDDVILPSVRLESYQKLCEFCGLTLNTQKSFNSGYFRESCGAHAFNGKDAKPVYLRSRIRVLLDIFRTANQLRRLAHQMNSGYSCDARFAKAYGFLTGVTMARKFQVRFERFYIPDGFGDFGLCVDFDTAAPFVKRDKWYQCGYRVSMLLPRYVRTRNVEDEYLLLTRLFELEKRKGWLPNLDSSFNWPLDSIDYNSLTSFLSDVAMRDSIPHGNEIVDLASPIRLSRKATVYVPSWRNLGPWL